jgi:hypothetical protein
MTEIVRPIREEVKELKTAEVHERWYFDKINGISVRINLPKLLDKEPEAVNQ